jgi:hypothetical protein
MLVHIHIRTNSGPLCSNQLCLRQLYEAAQVPSGVLEAPGKWGWTSVLMVRRQNTAVLKESEKLKTYTRSGKGGSTGLDGRCRTRQLDICGKT